MRGEKISRGQYKTGERYYRMLGCLLKSQQLVTLSFTLETSGFPEIADNQARQVRGPVNNILRVSERPFVELTYLEYDEVERAHREARARIADGASLKYDSLHRPIEEALSQALDESVSINMQSELGLIPVGIYCSVPFQIALDNLHILGLNHEPVSDTKQSN